LIDVPPVEFSAEAPPVVLAPPLDETIPPPPFSSGVGSPGPGSDASDEHPATMLIAHDESRNARKNGNRRRMSE
jgi:hypothetical protein